MKHAACLWMIVWVSNVAILAEPICYRTAEQAAAQAGTTDAHGFRLTAAHSDALGQREWLTVTHCDHPEWPSMLLSADLGQKQKLRSFAQGLTGSPQAPPKARPGQTSRPLLSAGASVEVVLVDKMARLQINGIAQSPGRLGDAVRVKVLGTGEERYVVGRVKSAEVLELVQ